MVHKQPVHNGGDTRHTFLRAQISKSDQLSLSSSPCLTGYFKFSSLLAQIELFKAL